VKQPEGTRFAVGIW